jgi:acetyl esterase/lipase
MFVARELTFKAAEFLPRSIDVSTHKLNQTVEKTTASSSRWYEVGAAEFRRMLYAGETHFPELSLPPNARGANVPSRVSGCEIPIWYYKPDNGERSIGVYLYLHGGGFVMGTHKE